MLSGENIAGLSAGYDAGADTVTASVDGTTYTYDAESSGDNGSISGYERDATDWYDYALRGETSSGRGEAFLINSTEDGFETAATFLSRFGTTTVPNDGTATYVGDYSGIFFGEEAEDSVWYGNITGDVSLTANFASDTISGSITNRDIYGDALSDVTLNAAGINDAEFSGTTSGSSGPNYAMAVGSYEGLFTGADGDEVVGAIRLDGTYYSDIGFEQGIFVAETP